MLVFFVVEREEKGKKKDNWNCWICFFCPKVAVSWRITVFQKNLAETPIFIVFFGCALSEPRCQTREILDTHHWKALFWHFCCFFVIFFFFLFFFVSLFFLFFLEDFGPPHLALNPPYLFLFCFFGFSFLFCFVCFFGGFKGQVRWPKGPPHLALNPPYLFCCCCFFFCCFAFFAFNRKTLFSP